MPADPDAAPRRRPGPPAGGVPGAGRRTARPPAPAALAIAAVLASGALAACGGDDGSLSDGSLPDGSLLDGPLAERLSERPLDGLPLDRIDRPDLGGERPEGACDPRTSDGCASGLRCTVLDARCTLGCDRPGRLGEDGACGAAGLDECAAGLLCLRERGQAEARCRRFCAAPEECGSGICEPLAGCGETVWVCRAASP